MAYGKRYTYTLKFMADTTDIRQQMQGVLNEMSGLLKSNSMQLFNTESTRAAQSDIMKLGQALQSAFNVDTNKLDLTKFQRQLASSNLSVEKLARDFQMLGPEGTKAFQNIANAISKAETPAFRLNGIMDNLWVTMKNTMRWQLTSSMLHGFMGTVQTAWRYTQDLNESLNSIRIVTGMSSNEMAQFAQEANKAAQALNTTTVNYTDASLIYYQQGLDTEEVKERTRITIDAANAAGTSAEQMSEYLTAVWNSYQVATDQLESYVDKMAAVGANTATSLEEISTAMVNVASTANTVGVSMDQLTAIISTVASTTRQSATTIGTAYKTIFARMGDLKLGETLEDGLDLGTVSKQIESVGVKILDVNGDLREMGSVVEEIGEKWQGWTTAQQTAVAQAIAGKRQYTQLIALFDNWDAYQNAFDISANSEGTLATQAEVFAESWEAARKNVKAAAEGIYDSLINAESMVKVDKFLAKTLNYVEEFVDSIGGLSGVVSILGFTLTNVFGNQLTASLRNVGDSLLELTGKQEKLNEEYRTEFIEKAKSMGLSENEAAVMESRLNLMSVFNKTRGQMSEKQLQEFQNELQLHDLLLDRVEALMKGTKELQEQVAIYKEMADAANSMKNSETNLYTQLSKNPFFNMKNASEEQVKTRMTYELQSHNPSMSQQDIESTVNKQYQQGLAQEEARLLANIEKRNAALGITLRLNEQINNIRKLGTTEEQKGAKITEEQRAALQEIFKLFGKKVNSGVKQEVGELSTQLEGLNSSISRYKNWSSLETKMKNIVIAAREGATAAQEAIPVHSQLADADGKLGDAAQKAADTGRKFGESLYDQSAATAAANLNAEQLTEQLEKLSATNSDWASKIVSMGQAISGLSMAFNSLSNIYKTFDEGFDSFEDLRSVLMSTSMIIPVIVKYTRELAKVAAISAAAAQGETGAYTGNIAIKLVARATNFLLAKSAITAATAEQVLAKAQLASLGIIGLVIVGVMGLVAAFDALIVTQKEASEAISEATDKYEQEKQKLDELTNSVQSLSDKIDELNEKDSLTLTEKEELTKLEQELALLKQQEEVQKRLAQAAQREAAKAMVGKDGSTKANSFTSQLNMTHAIATGNTTTTDDGYSIPEYEYLTALEYRKKYIDDVENLDDEEYARRIAKYEQFLQQEQDALSRYLAENAENIQNAEDNFAIFMEAINSGAYEASRDEINEQLASIKSVRMSIYGNNEEEYQEVFIKPVLDYSAIQEADSLFKNLAESAETDLSQISVSEEIENLLDTAGVSVDDFLAYLDDRVDKTRSRVEEQIGDIGDHIDELSGEDWKILADLDLSGVEDWEDLVQALEDHKENKIEVGIKVEDFATAIEEARSALKTIAEGTFLDEETIEKLKNTFADFYDFSNLEDQSLYDQARTIGEALLMATDPLAQLLYQNEELKEAFDEYNEVLKANAYELQEITDRQLDLKNTVFGNIDVANREVLNNDDGSISTILGSWGEFGENGIPIAFSPLLQTGTGTPELLTDETLFNYIDALLNNLEGDWTTEDLLALDAEGLEIDGKRIKKMIADVGDTAEATAENMHLISAGLEVEEVKDQFEDLYDSLREGLDIDPIEIDFDIQSAKVDAVVAQLGAVEKAAGLIGEGYKVQMKDIETLSKTMPQLFEDAIFDAKTGVLQLNQAVVDAVSESVQEEAMLTAEGLRQQLVDRWNWLQGNIDILNKAKENAYNARKDEVTSEKIFNGMEREERIALVKSIIKARLQQAVQIRSAGDQDAANEIHNQNEVTKASSEQAPQVAENWRKALDAADRYFFNMAVNAIAYQNQITEGTPISRTYAIGSTVVGFSANASELSSNTDTSAGDRWNALNQFIKDDFQITGANNEIIEQALANEISGLIGELGLDIDANTILQGTDAVLEAFASSYESWEDFTKDVDAALSDKKYELGLTGVDLGKLLSGINGGKLLEDAGKKKSSSKSNKKEGSELDPKELEERYHEINKLIEEQERLLKKVQTQIDRTYGASKLKEYNKEQERLNDLIASQQTKMDEARDWATKDLAKIRELGLTPEVSDQGRLLNATAMMQQVTDEYNKFVDEWNSHANEVAEGEGKTWQELNKKRKEEEEKKYQDRLDAIKKFEESVKTYWDEFEQREQYLRDLEDNKLAKIAYVLEFNIDYKNAKKDVRDLAKTIEESIGDALNHGIKVAELNFQNMQDELNMKGIYDDNFSQLLQKIDESKTNKYIDQEELKAQLESLRDNVIGSAEALIEWAESIEDIVPDAIDAARERFNQFTDQLEHNTSIIDTVKELMTLQGLTIKTRQGYNDTMDMYRKRIDATLADAKLSRQWNDNVRKELEIAQAALANATEGTQEYDILKANRDALLAEFNDSQQAMLEKAKETMETAREMYVDSVERTAYELEQLLTKGDGFDLLQDKYDHYIDTEERYLDTVNKIYETTKLNNKIQESLDKTTNAAHAKRLKELQEEFQQREKNNKLSQYDIEIMNAKLQMLQAQMALEDAANNRNTLRLVRNSRGNYDYQFTANPDEVNDLNQEYLDAANEYYNIAKDKVKEVSGEIIDTWQEMTEKIKEIYEDETLTVDEREARIAEIREYYTQKVKDLESEKQKAILDMTEAGNIAIDDFREAHKNTLESMEGDVNNFRDIFSDDLASILEGTDDFNNQFALDMDELSKEVENFDEHFDNTINDMNEHVNEYQETQKRVNEEVGVSYDDLKNILDEVGDSTEQISWKGQEAVQSMWDQISAAQQASISYAEMADSILDAARAYQELANAINQAQFERLGNAGDVSYDNEEFFDKNYFDKNTDYSAVMSKFLAEGGDINSKEFQELLHQRNLKVDWLQTDAGGNKGSEYWGTTGSATLDMFQNLINGKGDQDWYTGAAGKYSDEEYKMLLRKLGITSLATGGYTGDFDNGKLAILHEKELVLNAEDTKNILDAVELIHGGKSIWTEITAVLDASVTFFKTLLAGRLTPNVSVQKDKDILEQRVEIKAEFPSVTDSNEIEEALSNIINNAAQFASERR